jgi:pimeloyl-ACP methyl ester carboxylesterase
MTPDTPVESKFVLANSINIHYQERGTGKPLIMLHGGTANLHSYDEQISLFAEHFRVIALDSRGHGRTNNTANHLSYALMADDVIAFAHALNLEKPAIFGYSDGGQIALDLGIRYPTFASALCLGGTLYRFTPEYFDMLHSWGFTPTGVDISKLDEGWQDYLKSSHEQYTDETQLATFMNHIAAMWFTPLTYTDDHLRGIQAPTLMWLGDREQGLPVEQAVTMYRLIPQGDLCVIPNATHGSFFAPYALGPVVEFFKRHVNGS